MSTLSLWSNRRALARWHASTLSLALTVLFALPASAAALAPLPAKLWDAVIVANEVEVPFRLELSTRAGKLEGAFFNGDERVRSTDGSLKAELTPQVEKLLAEKVAAGPTTAHR